MSIADDPRKSLLSDSAAGRARALGRVRSALSFRTISAIYIFAALFVLFSLWVPSTFLTVSVWKSLIDDQALTALVAIGLVIPLASGSFNLAVGTEVGMAGVFVAWLLTHESLPIVPAIAIALLGGAAVGTVSGLLIVRAKIDSFIATLGISSILTALTAWLSNSEQILNLGNGFSAISNDQFLGLTWPVWIMLGAAIIVWYVLERTSVGRRVYATGGNPSAARLAGVRTSRVIVVSLAACGVLAATAGILQSAQLNTGDPTIGPGYLLPAYAAAFLGSTQLKEGRYNVWGTVIAVFVLATGVKGLQLAGAPVWIPDLFDGVALLLAVAMAKWRPTAARSSSIRRTLRLDRRSTPEQTQPS
jgi:ribose transport system permease protein